MDEEFIPLENIGLVNHNNNSIEFFSSYGDITEGRLPPPLIKSDSYHKSLGIIIEPETEEDDSLKSLGDVQNAAESIDKLDTNDIILDGTQPPLFVVTDDEYGKFYELNLNKEIGPDEIARNFQKFIETSDNDSDSEYNYNCTIEPEVILAENDEEIELVNDSNADATSDAKKSYRCTICGREVASRYNLKRHVMIHTGQKPHECELCHKRFREYSDVRKHKRVHDREDFSCKICFRSVSMPNNPRKCFYCVTNQSRFKQVTPIKMEQLDTILNDTIDDENPADHASNSTDTDDEDHPYHQGDALSELEEQKVLVSLQYNSYYKSIPNSSTLNKQRLF